MARVRKSSMEVLEEKILKAQQEVVDARKRYDDATAQLKDLMDKRDAMRKEEIMAAISKSSRTYEEILDFLNPASDNTDE